MSLVVTPLIAPLVAQNINAGVCIVPCGVVIVPVRAREHDLLRLNVKLKVIEVSEPDLGI